MASTGERVAFVQNMVRTTLGDATQPLSTVELDRHLRDGDIRPSEVYWALIVLERAGVVERRRDLMENRARPTVMWQLTPVDLDNTAVPHG